MADRETLLAINAQLVSKLTDGTATDDDFKTLEVVMGLLEKDAATGSISSSVPQTVTIGRWGSPAGASAAAASVQIIGKRKDRGRTEVLVKQSGGGESQWQPIKSVSAAALAEYEVKRQRQQLQQSRMGGAAKPAKQPQAAEADGADPTDERVPFRLLAQRRCVSM